MSMYQHVTTQACVHHVYVSVCHNLCYSPSCLCFSTLQPRPQCLCFNVPQSKPVSIVSIFQYATIHVRVHHVCVSTRYNQGHHVYVLMYHNPGLCPSCLYFNMLQSMLQSITSAFQQVTTQACVHRVYISICYNPCYSPSRLRFNTSQPRPVSIVSMFHLT